MIKVNAFCAQFHPAMHDGVLKQMGRDTDGVFLLVPTGFATVVNEAMKITPLPIPCVYTRNIRNGWIEYRTYEGDILARIEGLAIPTYAEAQNG
jgi:hypothetical protein